MITAPKYHSRLVLLAATMAIILFCASAAAIITGWMPDTIGLPADIAAIQQSN